MSTTWRRGISSPRAKGRVGERYILGGENLTLAAILAEIARIVRPQGADDAACRSRRCGRSRWWPRPVAAPPASEPFVTLDGLRMARKKMFFTSAKAERELGYRARPAADGLADAVAWFRRAGMCP